MRMQVIRSRIKVAMACGKVNISGNNIKNQPTSNVTSTGPFRLSFHTKPSTGVMLYHCTCFMLLSYSSNLHWYKPYCNGAYILSPIINNFA